jgi:hypothetical protein
MCGACCGGPGPTPADGAFLGRPELDRLPGGTLEAKRRLQRLADDGLVEWAEQEAGTRALRRGLPPHRLPVDWDALTSRRGVRLRRMDGVETYARGGRCRRRMLLGYFGEEAPARCGRCDECTGM